MTGWVVWLVVAAALAAGEILTLGFFLGPVAIAAVLAAIVALLGAGVEIQLAVFAAASGASLLFLRPIARRHMHMPAMLRTGSAALVGRRALVLDRVDPDGGSVKIGGEVWSARPFDEESAFEAGTRVEVLAIDGATALVAD
jgi:membrane protein implicated in regulation of membrane protease activity